MTTYSRSRDAARAARIKLGKDAKIGVDFMITEADGKFTWATKPVDTMTATPVIASAAAEAHEDKVTGPVASGKPKRKKTAKAKVTGTIRKYMVKRRGAEDVTGKRRKLVRMLLAKDGVSLHTLQNTLGWQKHTIRGAISTLKSEKVLKKIYSFKTDKRGRCYKGAA